MNKNSARRKYVPPLTRNLSDLAVSGGNPGPEGVCNDGQFPWNTCAQGFSYGDPSNCNPVGAGPTLGNNCQTGPNPDTGTSQCFPVGSNAGNTCATGTWA